MNSQPPTRHPAAPRHGRGFALVLCLWAVVIILLLAAALDSYVGARIEQARLIRLRLQDELDLYSTRSTVLYLLGTQRFTRAGLTSSPEKESMETTAGSALRIDPVGGEIALDATPYRGLGRTGFSLQDETGLIALNSDEQDDLRALLAEFGTEEAESSRLLDALADYRDANTLSRLNGAEADQYAAAGEAPPADFQLRSAAEITRVLGWRDWLAAHPEFRVHDWLSASRVAAFNPNVMPPGLIARLPGMDEDKTLAILAQRREQPFRSLPDFDARVDLPLARAEEQYRFFPSDSLHLRVWRDGAAHAEQLALQLTPLGQQGPWQIKSIYRVTQHLQDEAHEVPGFLFGTGTSSDF